MIKTTQVFAHVNIYLSKSGDGAPPDSFVYYLTGQENYKTKNQNTKKKQNRVSQRAEENKQNLHYIFLKNTYLATSWS